MSHYPQLPNNPQQQANHFQQSNRHTFRTMKSHPITNTPTFTAHDIKPAIKKSTNSKGIGPDNTSNPKHMFTLVLHSLPSSLIVQSSIATFLPFGRDPLRPVKTPLCLIPTSKFFYSTLL
ncbi:hypothetical protein HELRODRAFT_184713 [Helobdella robusta]|uniref:Uncharacterized protein n=1 Tax=Helobdella robusta TaxID=6412 RepID=T1FLU3_HELRO|nr:hypothetical protein HELRODRAFT_184713 [Helobdella robusta]ESO04133.1 hypothetical protein HELRODRAFT_184713 [Helobdella robusta]